MSRKLTVLYGALNSSSMCVVVADRYCQLGALQLNMLCYKSFYDEKPINLFIGSMVIDSRT